MDRDRDRENEKKKKKRAKPPKPSGPPPTGRRRRGRPRAAAALRFDLDDISSMLRSSAATPPASTFSELLDSIESPVTPTRDSGDDSSSPDTSSPDTSSPVTVITGAGTSSRDKGLRITIRTGSIARVSEYDNTPIEAPGFLLEEAEDSDNPSSSYDLFRKSSADLISASTALSESLLNGFNYLFNPNSGIGFLGLEVALDRMLTENPETKGLSRENIDTLMHIYKKSFYSTIAYLERVLTAIDEATDEAGLDKHSQSAKDYIMEKISNAQHKMNVLEEELKKEQVNPDRIKKILSSKKFTIDFNLLNHIKEFKELREHQIITDAYNEISNIVGNTDSKDKKAIKLKGYLENLAPPFINRFLPVEILKTNGSDIRLETLNENVFENIKYSLLNAREKRLEKIKDGDLKACNLKLRKYSCILARNLAGIMQEEPELIKEMFDDIEAGCVFYTNFNNEVKTLSRVNYLGSVSLADYTSSIMQRTMRMSMPLEAAASSIKKAAKQEKREADESPGIATDTTVQLLMPEAEENLKIVTDSIKESQKGIDSRAHLVNTISEAYDILTAPCVGYGSDTVTIASVLGLKTDQMEDLKRRNNKLKSTLPKHNLIIAALEAKIEKDTSDDKTPLLSQLDKAKEERKKVCMNLYRKSRYSFRSLLSINIEGIDKIDSINKDGQLVKLNKCDKDRLKRTLNNCTKCILTSEFVDVVIEEIYDKFARLEAKKSKLSTSQIENPSAKQQRLLDKHKVFHMLIKLSKHDPKEAAKLKCELDIEIKKHIYITSWKTSVYRKFIRIIKKALTFFKKEQAVPAKIMSEVADKFTPLLKHKTESTGEYNHDKQTTRRPRRSVAVSNSAMIRNAGRF